MSSRRSVLALAALATAWAAYQSRLSTGEQSTGYSRATTARLTENRSAALADRQVQIDVTTFSQWLDARARHEDELARFYSVRFRPEFQPAFAAWLATEPCDTGARIAILGLGSVALIAALVWLATLPVQLTT